MRSLLVYASAFAISLSFAACGGGDDDDDDDTVDAAGDDDDDDVDASTATPTCENYCATIETNCSGELDQYGSNEICLAACAAFEVGESGATSGGTLGCREYHANAAAGAPDVHCAHAGPLGGDGTCGTACEGFCAIALDACPDAFADAADCADQCAGFDATEPYDTSDTAGDSLACRTYHLTVATTTPVPHCTHIDEASPTCVEAK
jgi:hypothetical protein